MKYLIGLLTLFMLASCMKGQKVDLIIYNANIHSFNDANSEFQAVAIRDGKIIELGPDRQILNKYRCDVDFDAHGKSIYPGFSDAHTHILLWAQERLAANLNEVNSIPQLLVSLEKYQAKSKFDFILARNLSIELFNQLDNTELNRLFPNTPVYLITKDGHAAIVNDKAIKHSNLLIENNISTGKLSEQLFIDSYARFPKFPSRKVEEQLFEIQEELLQYGIVAIHEMGWENDDYLFFEKLTKKPEWKLQISAYLFPSEANKKLLKNGIKKAKNLQVRGFKLFIDGTFGSQTAAVISPYKDGTNGVINWTNENLSEILIFAADHELQIAAHTAGDRAAQFFLENVKSNQLNINNLKWRIEHLQVVNPTVLKLLEELYIIPSVQPFHAVSDASWIYQVFQPITNNYYPYNSLFETLGMLAIGSDLPIDQYNPYEIIWAATTRTDMEKLPAGGFIPSQRLPLKEVLKSFIQYNSQIVDLENELGSLEAGKNATFFIANTPITNQFNSTYNYATQVFIKGKKTYSTE